MYWEAEKFQQDMILEAEEGGVLPLKKFKSILYIFFF